MAIVRTVMAIVRHELSWQLVTVMATERIKLSFQVVNYHGKWHKPPHLTKQPPTFLLQKKAVPAS